MLAIPNLLSPALYRKIRLGYCPHLSRYSYVNQRKGPKELSGSLFDCTRIAQPVIFLTAVGSVSTKHRSTKQRHETHTSRTQLGLYVYHRNASA